MCSLARLVAQPANPGIAAPNLRVVTSRWHNSSYSRCDMCFAHTHLPGAAAGHCSTLATFAHLAAGVLFIISVIVNKFTLERSLVLAFCAELDALDCADPAVTAASARWIRWVLFTMTVAALFTLPIAGAVSDLLKARAPEAVDSRVPLLLLQLIALAVVPATWLSQMVFDLPRWTQIAGAAAASLFGGQINVFMPTWYAVRSDLFLADVVPISRPKSGGDGGEHSGQDKDEHIRKGSAFLRMELMLLVGVTGAGRLESIALDAAPGNEPSALRALYGFSLACALGSSVCILIMQRAAGAHLAARTQAPAPAPAPAVIRGGPDVFEEGDEGGDKGGKVPPRPEETRLQDALLTRSFGHILATARHAAGRATRPQLRFACLLALVFSIANSTEGMSNLLTVYLGANGFSAGDMALGVQLSGLSQTAIVGVSICLLPAVGSVEAFVVVYAAISALGWATLAAGVALRSHLLEYAHYLIAGTWGPVIVMTRSLVVLYSPEATLGTALASLGMLDEAVTTLGDFTYTTLLARTAASWPPAPPVLATAMMATCCALAYRMAVEPPRENISRRDREERSSSQLV
jgi:hypothetical protein